MKNHTVTVNYFELHQVPIGFRRMTTSQVSSLGFRGCERAGNQGGGMDAVRWKALKLIPKEVHSNVA